MGYKDKDKQREYQRKWYAARREEFFRDKSCVKCGSTAQLELDHIDPSSKVSHRIWSWSSERRNTEIAKCQILCRTCHEAKSLWEGPKAPVTEHGATMYRNGCRCSLCRRAQADRNRAIRARQKLGV